MALARVRGLAVGDPRTMALYLLIALGGALGTMSRYGVGILTQRFLNDGFPYGTLTVNVVGCFLMGLIGTIGAKTQVVPQFVVAAATIGFLGGFTTFSAFGNETFRHFEAGRTLLALGNIAANVCLGLLAVWAGNLMAKLMVGGS